MKDFAKRNPAMDIIRCFALFSVIALHFFMNAEFLDYPVEGLGMSVATMVRTFFMICVPLFLTLSGFLMKNKSLSRAYYKGITKTLAVYVLVSVACMVYRFIVNRESFSFMGSVWGIFNFSTAPYAWYIEMYIGLFLLMPFLNLAFNNLKTKRHKQCFVGTMLILTALPHILNIWQFFNLGWWLSPSSNANYDIIFPEWWIGIYPITYYIIGCYLREYPLKLKKWVNGLLIVATFFVIGLFNCYRSYGSNYVPGGWQQHASILNVIQTVLIFSFFANLDYSKIGAKGARFLKYISDLCLGAYLCSWIFDSIFYKILNTKITNVHLRLEWFVVLVPLVLVCSLALSAVINGIYSVSFRVCSTALQKIKNRRNTTPPEK